jgi:hypothetical protein
MIIDGSNIITSAETSPNALRGKVHAVTTEILKIIVVKIRGRGAC